MPTSTGTDVGETQIFHACPDQPEHAAHALAYAHDGRLVTSHATSHATSRAHAGQPWTKPAVNGHTHPTASRSARALLGPPLRCWGQLCSWPKEAGADGLMPLVHSSGSSSGLARPVHTAQPGASAAADKSDTSSSCVDATLHVGKLHQPPPGIARGSARGKAHQWRSFTAGSEGYWPLV